MSSSYAAQSDDFDAFIDFNAGMDTAYAPEDNQTFSGPSHDYHLLPQQTGFSASSLSNVAAYNDSNMENDFMGQPDFNSSYTGPIDGFNPGVDYSMDFGRNSAASAFHQTSSGMEDSIDPTAIYGQSQPAVRMYPGMHSQQAAEQAKASALAKQEQQQQQQQQQLLMQRYQQQQQQKAQSSSTLEGKKRAGSHAMTDAVAERKISDILDGMRHQGNIFPIDEEDMESHNGKSRLNDDDIDEDERLLASEEGKKLSSKERRQLRNKVSARAFRSRRKEYISQLEGDLATKANEANDLRLINRKLLEENNQLKNLTRTVLSHPAFHSFLDDMSRNPTFVPPPAHLTGPKPISAPMESLPSNAPKHEIKQESEPEHQLQQRQQFHPQEDVQLNMAQMPQNSLDLSMMNLGNNHWNSQQSSGQTYQPQVFAIFDLPKGPSKEDLAGRRSISAVPASLCLSRTSAIEPPRLSRREVAVPDSVEGCIAHMNLLFDTLSPDCTTLDSRR